MHVSESVEIAAPPERVWAVIADVERWAEWTASIQRIELLDGGPLVSGARAKVKQPRVPAAIWRVTEFVPGRSFTWVTSSPGQRSEGMHSVQPDGAGGSVATLTWSISGPVGWVLGRLIGGMARRYVRLEAEGLRARAEEMR